MVVVGRVMDCPAPVRVYTMVVHSSDSTEEYEGSAVLHLADIGLS